MGVEVEVRRPKDNVADANSKGVSSTSPISSIAPYTPYTLNSPSRRGIRSPSKSLLLQKDRGGEGEGRGGRGRGVGVGRFGGGGGGRGGGRGRGGGGGIGGCREERREGHKGTRHNHITPRDRTSPTLDLIKNKDVYGSRSRSLYESGSMSRSGSKDEAASDALPVYVSKLKSLKLAEYLKTKRSLQ